MLKPAPFMLPKPLILLILCAALPLVAAEKPLPPVPDDPQKPPFEPSPEAAPRILLPGFVIRELPVKLTSLNNLEYAPDGRLFAGGYDGRFHLLRDRDGDGLEEEVTTFQPESTPNYPLGIVVHEGDPCFALTDEIVRWRDTDGDGVPDQRETIAKGFDDPELVKAKYLSHRRVDSSMALARGSDDAWYVTMGNAGYNNPYWQEDFPKGQKPSGRAHYHTGARRGCLLRITDDGKVERLNSGLRYIMSLQFNRHGDLFGTDQEGATWCPNGNPFDELLHLQTGRHYGFPPRHPVYLPDVADEPSVWDYAPQHQSTCGFRFNTPTPGRGRFGPSFWEDNAIVTGESRGILWRTALEKTASGYVARTEGIARLNLITVDCAISPQGDLLVACHTGKPDWGNGPQGEGRLFKISYEDAEAPQPVLAWAASETETVVTYDRPVKVVEAGDVTLRAGRYLSAGDHLETMRPPYAVVAMQQRQPVSTLPVKAVRSGDDGRSLVITTVPRRLALHHDLKFGDTALAYDLTGVQAEWSGEGTDGTWTGWLPHPDLGVARAFTKGSAPHEALWARLASPGRLTLRTRLDLWNLMQPATQPGSVLDYTPSPETVTMIFRSDAPFQIEAANATVDRVNERESRLTLAGPKADQWLALALTLETPAKRLDVSYTTLRDKHERAPGVRRFLLPFAEPAPADLPEEEIPELSGGDWEKGRALFNGKAVCSTCHNLRGEGVEVGPDLNNLIHRDYAGVLRDIVDPGAVIHPDAIGYTVTQTNGQVTIGTRVGETKSELHLAQPGGLVAKIAKSAIAKTEALPVSLMPAGLDQALTKEELRDLMTYLLRDRK